MATVFEMVNKEFGKVDPNGFWTSPAVNDLRAGSSYMYSVRQDLHCRALSNLELQSAL